MKKFIYLILLTLLIFSCSDNLNEEENLNDFTKDSGSFVDERDGHKYKWVRIGEQIWMGENLAYDTENGSWAYNSDEGNVAVYGRLYTWETAKSICPAGWHLPSKNEWEQLAMFITYEKGYSGYAGEGWVDVGKHIKAKGTIEDGNGLWFKYHELDIEGIAGTDYYGFSALPGGIAYWEGGSVRNYTRKGIDASFWSSSLLREYYAYPFSLGVGGNLSGGNSISRTKKWNKSTGMSVRYIKDSVE